MLHPRIMLHCSIEVKERGKLLITTHLTAKEVCMLDAAVHVCTGVSICLNNERHYRKVKTKKTIEPMTH